MYFSPGFQTKNLPVFRPSLNQPLNLVYQFKLSYTPRPCLSPLRNSPQYSLLSQKQRKPQQGQSLIMGQPQQMQFLNFLIEGDLMTISQLMQRLVKNEKISEGSARYTTLYFLQQSITIFSAISRIFFALFAQGQGKTQFLRFWRTIWPAFWLSLEECIMKLDQMGVWNANDQNSHCVDAFFLGDSKEKLISLLQCSVIWKETYFLDYTAFECIGICYGFASKAALIFLS